MNTTILEASDKEGCLTLKIGHGVALLVVEVGPTGPLDVPVGESLYLHDASGKRVGTGRVILRTVFGETTTSREVAGILDAVRKP